ncbi:MAG: macro domain-containing protein, partial [Baekduiaceae bacterium]
WVIHAATMEPGGPTGDEAIRGATASALRVAEELGCHSVALPAFGTGVGGFPVDRAAELMMGAIPRPLAGGSNLGHVIIAVRGDRAKLAFELVEDD